jgi:signal transduction histidine kinase
VIETETRVNILLVDDQPANLLALEAILESLGQNIAKAHSGEEALRLLIRQDFAVILLDVMMPGMDGFETAALIHQRDRSRHMPIIFLTAGGNTEAQICQGYAAGAIDYMVKPFIPEVLRSKVSVLMDLYRKTGEVRHLNEELSLRAQELETLNLILKSEQKSLKKNEEQLRLSQKMDAIGRLAGGVAHDFNNLLSVIEGNSDFLKAFFSPGDPHLEEVEEIKKAVQQGAELTRSLLALGRKQVSQPQLVNLNVLSSEMSRMFKRLIDASVDFAVIQDEELKWFLSDPGQIQQLILNLVLNARDAMPKGGNLIVVTKNVESAEVLKIQGITIPPGSYVGLSVTDTGTGMDEETQKQVFEPFFTTKGEKGTGLGLATVYGIVNQWEGHLWLRSTPGVGTTFSIYFPAVNEAGALAVKPKRKSLAAIGSETILVAEDEEQVRKIVVRAMENYGYQVLQAENGFDAVQQARNYKEPIHLLLTDTVMPKMNGKELAEELKKFRPEAKVLFMSGYPQEVLSQQGKIDASINLIQKPFSNDQLANRIREVLDQELKKPVTRPEEGVVQAIGGGRDGE